MEYLIFGWGPTVHYLWQEPILWISSETLFKKVSPLSIYNCISFLESLFQRNATRIQGTRLNGNKVAPLTGHAILCRSRSRGRMRCPRQEYKRGLWERDYIVFSARLKPCACQYGILNGKNRPLIFKSLRKRVNPGPAVVHLSLWLLNPGVGTPGNSWWGCATRFVKPWPDVRPKNVIFHTRFQTWPLGRNYVIIT